MSCRYRSDVREYKARITEGGATVMAGLVPAIRATAGAATDDPDKPGHDARSRVVGAGYSVTDETEGQGV
jgi:hypothetical protein